MDPTGADRNEQSIDRGRLIGKRRKSRRRKHKESLSEVERKGWAAEPRHCVQNAFHEKDCVGDIVPAKNTRPKAGLD